MREIVTSRPALVRTPRRPGGGLVVTGRATPATRSTVLGNFPGAVFARPQARYPHEENSMDPDIYTFSGDHPEDTVRYIAHPVVNAVAQMAAILWASGNGETHRDDAIDQAETIMLETMRRAEDARATATPDLGPGGVLEPTQELEDYVEEGDEPAEVPVTSDAPTPHPDPVVSAIRREVTRGEPTHSVGDVTQPDRYVEVPVSRRGVVRFDRLTELDPRAVVPILAAALDLVDSGSKSLSEIEDGLNKIADAFDGLASNTKKKLRFF